MHPLIPRHDTAGARAPSSLAKAADQAEEMEHYAVDSSGARRDHSASAGP